MLTYVDPIKLFLYCIPKWNEHLHLIHTETPPTHNFSVGSVKALDYSLADIHLIKKGLIKCKK